MSVGDFVSKYPVTCLTGLGGISILVKDLLEYGIERTRDIMGYSYYYDPYPLSRNLVPNLELGGIVLGGLLIVGVVSDYVSHYVIRRIQKRKNEGRI
jgi:hypothetical protein